MITSTEKLEQSKVTLENENESLMEQCDVLKTKLEKLTGDYQLLESRDQETTTRCDDLEQVNEKLQNQVSLLESECQKIQVDSNTAKDQLKLSIVLCHENIERLEKVISKGESQIQYCNATIMMKDDEIVKLKDDYASAESTHQEKLQTMESRLESCKDESNQALQELNESIKQYSWLTKA